MELVVFALVVAAILIFRVFKLDRFWADDEDKFVFSNPFTDKKQCNK